MPPSQAAWQGRQPPHGTAPAAAMLDTYREVLTPEGVALHLPAAGPVPRALAWLIDLVVRMAILAALSMVLGMLGGLGAGLYLIGLFLVYWAYPIVLEAAEKIRRPNQPVSKDDIAHAETDAPTG